MKAITFSTDGELNLRSWQESGGDELRGSSGSELEGKKYYEIFPRIFLGEDDALSVAAQRKHPVQLEGYSLPCLYAHFSADITINPAWNGNGVVNEIRVTVRPQTPCSIAKKLTDSQRLIDIGKMASTLAHGVRNPLNAIKGSVVYLREKYSYEAPLIEFTKMMEEEISRLELFISRFLSSSLSDAERASTDINSLLKKIQVFTAYQVSAQNITPFFDLREVPLVTVDAFHVEQALLNVVNNAIDAMKGGGTLTVRTSTETMLDSTFVVIGVSDTGPGMTDQTMGNLSERTNSAGKGFGLFIAYEVLKYYGGHLKIESKKNEGTSVRLYLPLAESRAGAI